MQNKDGKDCWLEFSSSKQCLSYGEYGPLRIKVEGEEQGITAATRLNNGTIDYITVTPTQGYKGNKVFDFSHTKTGSCGSGCWSLGKEDTPVKFGSEMEQVELFKDTVTRFIDLMKSST